MGKLDEWDVRTSCDEVVCTRARWHSCKQRHRRVMRPAERERGGTRRRTWSAIMHSGKILSPCRATNADEK